MNAGKLAAGLGWFSLGLGLYEVAAPGHLSRVLGMEGRKGLLRGYGLREIFVGAAILSEPEPTAPWLWARVGGDALDLLTLGFAAARPGNPKRLNVGVAIGIVLGVTVLDVLCAQHLSTDAD